MRLPSLRKSRTRIALAGALLSAAFLVALALTTRAVIHGMTYADIDDELYTLAAAVGSSFELEGLEESRRDTLRAGLEANAFEFRLANHSAILFRGDAPFEASGNLMRHSLPGGIGPYRGRPKSPIRLSSRTADRTASAASSSRASRERRRDAPSFSSAPSSRVSTRSRGSTGRSPRSSPSVSSAPRASWPFAVGRAIRPVEDITRLAEELQASDLSRRVKVSKGRRGVSAARGASSTRCSSAWRTPSAPSADSSPTRRTS
jgi:hypothetical protein